MAWLRRERDRLPPFYLLSDPALVESRAARLGLSVAVERITPVEARQLFGRALPVVPLAAQFQDIPGHSSPLDAKGVIDSIDRAVADVRSGSASALVTCPIAKKTLYDAGFAYPGHTEYLAHLAGGVFPVMMMAGPSLRTVPVTIHEPLTRVPALLSTDLIVETGRIVARDLSRRFGVAKPRLAVAGLNPHAGESGSIGSEDETIVRPAVDALRAEGIEVTGPYPADTMFHPAARKLYDVALCMYHDQALIPAKTLAFDRAVNVTLGLPFVRTSPDHGTAFDIAGTGAARPDSLIAAIRMAARMSRRS